MKAEYKQIHWHFFTNQRNWQHRYTRRRKTEQKHNDVHGAWNNLISLPTM